MAPIQYADPHLLLNPPTVSRPRFGVLLGDPAHTHRLILQSIFSQITRGERVCLIVGDNLLELYLLSRALRRYGLDPKEALKSIEYSRSFTCNELHHCILRLDMFKAKYWSALYIQGLLNGFYDENIRYADGDRKLIEILKHLREIASGGNSVIVTVSRPPTGIDRQSFVNRVVLSSNAYWQTCTESARLPYEQMSLL